MKSGSVEREFAMARARLSMAAALAVSSLTAFGADPVLIEVDPGICAEEKFLGKIQKRFRYQVTHVPGLPDVAIEHFSNIREKRFEPEDERHPISRRYCEADIILSNGHSRDIWYLIETDQGFASIGDNVEFCVDGFDRWHVYNGACRVLR